MPNAGAESVKLLLDYRLDVNHTAKMVDGLMPLHKQFLEARSAGKRLTEMGWWFSEGAGQTPLGCAVAKGRLEMTKLLLAARSDVEHRNFLGHSVMDHARFDFGVDP